MKLRIRGNSFRLRLTKAEVQEIGSGKAVSETTPFCNGAVLTYILEPSERTSVLEAHLTGLQIKTLIPMAVAKNWAHSQEIAIKENSTLSILIEKDFACLKPRQNENEDESELFFNPNSATGHCGDH